MPRRFGEVVLDGPLSLPVYDDIRNVVNPVAGMRVQLTGTIQEPAGMWWYDGDRWFSGNRTRISAQRESVGGNATVILQQFDLPNNMELDVWQLQVTNLDGADDSLSLEVENTTDDSIIASYDGSNHTGEVQIGNPIAIGGSGGDTISVQANNTTGGNAEITGFTVISLQSTLT